MSFEVCPFCGKSFKRLKSHLPHCKAATGSTTSQHEEPQTKAKSTTKTDDSSLDVKVEKQQVEALITSKASKKRTPKWSKKVKMAAQMSSPASAGSSQPSSSSKSKTKIHLQSQNDPESITNHLETLNFRSNAEILPEPVSEPDKQQGKSSKTPKTSMKIKPKLSEKIKMAAKMSSPVSVLSSQTSSTSKSKTKMNLQTQNNQELISDSFEKLLNVENLPDFEKQEVRSSVAPKTSKKIKPKLSEKIKMAAEMSSPKPTIGIKRFEEEKETTESKKEDVKNILTNKTNKNNVRIAENNSKINLKDHFWPEEVKSLTEIDPWNSKGETKITLEDVRTTLRRAKQNGASKKSHLIHKTEQNFDILNQNKTENSLVKLQQEVPSQLMTLKSSKNEITVSKSEDFMSKLSKTENTDCNFTLRSEIFRDGLRLDHHTMGLAPVSGPVKTFLGAEVTTKSFSKDLVPLLNQNLDKNVSDMEQMRRDVRKQDGRQSTRGALTQQRLGQVTLRELPDWLVLKSPRRPRDVSDMVQRGWQWYYRRYIDVKKGGVGGVAMLLAGYCVLSYVWTFPHLKRDRWRKYH